MNNFSLKEELIRNSFKIISKKSYDDRGLFEKLFDINFLKKKILLKVQQILKLIMCVQKKRVH